MNDRAVNQIVFWDLGFFYSSINIFILKNELEDLEHSLKVL